MVKKKRKGKERKAKRNLKNSVACLTNVILILMSHIISKVHRGRATQVNDQGNGLAEGFFVFVFVSYSVHNVEGCARGCCMYPTTGPSLPVSNGQSSRYTKNSAIKHKTRVSCVVA